MDNTRFVFVKNALEKIISFRDARKNKLLNEIAIAILARIDRSTKNPEYVDIISASEIVLPLKLACEVKNWKVIVIALDCIQKMITFGYLHGEDSIEMWPIDSNVKKETANSDAQWTNGLSQGLSPREETLIDATIEAICSCFIGPETHEAVELQIIKVLVAAVATVTSELHDQSLLTTIRTCYNIYLLSQSQINQQTARVALTQMMTSIFQRIEGNMEGIRLEDLNFRGGVDPEKMSIKSGLLPKAESIFNLSRKVSKDDIEPVVVETKRSIEFWETQKETTAFDLSHDNSFEQTQIQAHIQENREKNQNHPEQDKENESKSDTEEKVSQDISIDQGTDDSSSVLTDNEVKTTLDSLPENSSDEENPYHKDAYLVLRALCRLSMKPISEFALSDPKSHALRSKILSLQLIQHILDHSGQTFRNGELFISAIKKYLTSSLCVNATFKDSQIFSVVSNIFMFVLTVFPAHIKYEIEVCFKEIFFKLLGSKNVAQAQKLMVLDLLKKVCSNPQILVDIFLNYDCDPQALDSNLFETIVNDLTKILQAKIEILDPQIGPSIEDLKIKERGLECVAAILQSLVNWSKEKDDINENPIEEISQDDKDGPTLKRNHSTDQLTDEADQFEQLKHHKQALKLGIEQFNWNAKKGLKILVESKVIGDSPQDIANFFLNTEGLNKKFIGEYLGGSDEQKIKTMHAFVDMLNFENLDFLQALRKFLQKFLLPGESQQIDRLMLKFAERYVVNNPTVFANADTAYVLAYSVIMLNVDQHNKKVKKKMTPEDFIRNNRGINDGKDLNEDLLKSIFEDISKNELKMKDEDQHVLHGGPKTKRDSQLMDSKEIMKSTQALLKDDKKRTKNNVYYSSHRIKHVKPMFEVVWMPILAGVFGYLQESDDDVIVSLSLQAFSSAIRIASIFDLELPGKTFISTLANFTLLSPEDNIPTKPKNYAAIRLIVEIGLRDGNHLKQSWVNVLQCVSRLTRIQQSEKLQQVEKMLDKAKRVRSSIDETNSQSMIVAIDRIFASSIKLNGSAIVDFVQALCIVSWEEIQNTSNTKNPRMYSLQKLVEISYYNMGRIRLEWSKIWSFLGEHFNKVGCHTNTKVATFAIDSLRQLSMKFLEKGELAHFQFQKDFLSPFMSIYSNNPSVTIKEFILHCISQLVLATARNIKSGWKAMLSIFGAAALEPTQALVETAFEATKGIINNHFHAIVIHGSFFELNRALLEFSQNGLFPKISLHSIELLHKLIPIIAEFPSSEKELLVSPSEQQKFSLKDVDQDRKFWFPIFSTFYEMILNCELEVRTRAVTYLIETLNRYGSSFSITFWESIFKTILFPLFDDLKQALNPNGNKNYQSQLGSKVDSTEWLSTTCVFALRNVLELYSTFFDKLSFLIDSVLDLFSTFLQQENESLSRIGSSCLVSFIETNCKRLNEGIWDKICNLIKTLFLSTTPQFLDFDSYQPPSNPNEKDPIQEAISKCQVQLLLIQTINELVNENTKIYPTVNSRHLLKILEVLYQSFQNSINFNRNFISFAKTNPSAQSSLPQLLQQENESAQCQLALIFKMYRDIKVLDRDEIKMGIELRLLSLCKYLLEQFSQLHQSKSIDQAQGWSATLSFLLDSLENLQDAQFVQHLPVFYFWIVNLIQFDLDQKVRNSIRKILVRVGTAFNVSSNVFA